MNVGGISGNNGFYYQNKVSNSNASNSFNEAINGAAGSQTPHLILHKSAEGDAEKTLGSWASARTGQSVSVCQPEDFDPANPVYKIKIWDKDDNLVEEREVDINSIDPQSADSYDMYALSVYGEKSGKNPSAVGSFIFMQSERESQQISQNGSYSFDTIENWMDILKDIIKQQYDVGNMDGYLKFKGYYEFLEGSK